MPISRVQIRDLLVTLLFAVVCYAVVRQRSSVKLLFQKDYYSEEVLLCFIGIFSSEVPTRRYCLAAMTFPLFGWIAIGLLLAMAVIIYVSRRRTLFLTNLRGKHIFLTGASSGIGLAVAKQTLREGAYLTLVARSTEKLNKVAESLLKELDLPAGRLLVKGADVGDYGAISTAVKESFDWRPIDILVNNAGITRSGFMEDFSVEDIDTVVQTNVLGSVYPVHAILPQLKLRSRDHPISIVFIGSLASLCWLYGNGVYTGTKYAVKGMAESLRLELIPYNMRVNLVCPGFVETGFLDNVDNDEELMKGMQVASFYNRKLAQSPEAVAKIAIAGIKKGTFLITTTPGLGAALVLLTRGFAPSDSFLLNLMEAIFIGPLRFLTYLSQAGLAQKLKSIHRKHTSRSALN